MPRPSIGETAMTGAERQARYRTMHADGAPVIRIRRPADRRSRSQRWNDTIAAAVELQAEYADWLDALPDNQQDSALAGGLAGDCRTRSVRASGDRAATRLRPRLNIEMAQTARVTMTHGADCQHQLVAAGTRRRCRGERAE
jgi:hypothetical protein